MAKLGEAWVNIRANLSPLKAGLRTAHAAIKKAMTTISRYIKRAMLLITASITGAIWAAMKFQKQMAMVSTMLDEKTMPIMEEYKRTLVSLSKEFGQSTATLSKGLYDILSASISAEKATEVLRIATRAAIAGITEAEVAADAITTIINAYGMSADRAADISDKLFATVKRGKLTFGELAGSIGRAAATAAIAGLSLEELLSLTATLTRAGINTAEAMTSISGTMRAFISPTKSAVQTAEEFGLVLSSDTLKTKGFIGAIKLLDKASAEQLSQIVPNIRAFKALAAALKDTAGFTYDLNLITNEFSGMAAEAYEKMSKTAGFQLDRFKQKTKATFTALGTPLLGPFEKLMDAIGKYLEKAEKWFEKNEVAIEKWADKVVVWIISTLRQWEIWLNMIRSGKIQKVFEEMTLRIIQIFQSMWDTLKTDVYPIAVKIGEAMGRGIMDGIKKEFPGMAKLAGIAKWTPQALIAKGAVAGAGGAATGIQTAARWSPQGLMARAVGEFY